jgi:hypothetical protein
LLGYAFFKDQESWKVELEGIGGFVGVREREATRKKRENSADEYVEILIGVK